MFLLLVLFVLLFNCGPGYHAQVSPWTAKFEPWRHNPCSADNLLLRNLPVCNTSLSFSERAQKYVSILSLSDLIELASNTNDFLSNWNVSAYQWWNEALHGVAFSGGVRYGYALEHLNPDKDWINATTMFPQVIGVAASLNRSLWHAIGDVISTEYRALFNNEQAGITVWAPNVNIFRYIVCIYMVYVTVYS